MATVAVILNLGSSWTFLSSSPTYQPNWSAFGLCILNRWSVEQFNLGPYWMSDRPVVWNWPSFCDWLPTHQVGAQSNHAFSLKWAGWKFKMANVAAMSDSAKHPSSSLHHHFISTYQFRAKTNPVLSPKWAKKTNMATAVAILHVGSEQKSKLIFPSWLTTSPPSWSTVESCVLSKMSEIEIQDGHCSGHIRCRIWSKIQVDAPTYLPILS